MIKHALPIVRKNVFER